MEDEKLLAILRLQKSKAIGDILAKKLIVTIGNVEQIFKEKASTLEQINGIGSHATKHLFDKKNHELAAQELAAQQAQEAAMKEQAALREIRTFYFDFDEASIKTDSRPALAAHAAFLSANPSVKIVLEGHTDERGTKGYNMALGERRANSVQKFLVVNGVSKAQIEVVSFGEERPAIAEHTEAAWSQNRRAYIEYK